MSDDDKKNPPQKPMATRSSSKEAKKEAAMKAKIARELHKEEIAAGDHHDPNALELFCDMHPDEPECLVYDD